MSYTFHEEEYRGCKIRIEQDEFPENPREDFDPLGEIFPVSGGLPKDKRLDADDIFAHLSELAQKQLRIRERLTGKTYDVYGDDTCEDTMPMPDNDKLLDMAEADNIIVPFRLSDCGSSGRSLDSDCDLDRATGFIHVSLAAAKKWCGGGTDEEVRASARNILLGELSTVENYFNGYVAEYIAEDPDGNTIESCCGFYPDEHPKEWGYPISCARAAIDHWHEKQEELALQLCSNI